MTVALELEDLHFGYGRRAAVRGVSLRLQPGDCYGFLGHNGAGKTTVMRLCLGLLRPTRGRVTVFGHDGARERRRANSLVGALIERPGFHLHWSARSNLVALARLQGIPGRLAKAESERVLDRIGLEYAADRRVATFSMGMRQRLGIAQALLGKPRLLLLDEPTNGLDPEGIADLRQLLVRLTRDDGVAVMLSSHQLAELEGLCNRVGVLRDGEMVVEGDLTELRRRIAVRHLVAGEPVDALQQRLESMHLQPERDGDRLLVDLRDQPPGDVARALANCAALREFAPEQATLERIYLQSADGGLAAAGDQPPAAAPEPEFARSTVAGLGSVRRPRRRAFTQEATTALRQRASALLLLLPCAVAAYTVWSYRRRVASGTALVESGERFSADAGSGFLALAQALQNATPVLCVVLLWLSSQIVAADFAGDTLRNTLQRSLRRRDVLFAKVGVLLSTVTVGWLLLVAAAAAMSWATLGFGDLEEVSRYGDRDLLAEAGEVLPTLLVCCLQLLLPLAALVAIGAAASAVTRRPATALLAAAMFALVPETMRGTLDDRAGWLLTSHLPVLWQDESAIGYCAATARGAADALWPWAEQAVLAPAAWLAFGLLVTGTALHRMRIR